MTDVDVSDVRLRDEQKKLFVLIVEAFRNANPEYRHHGFALQGTSSGISILMTPPPAPNEEVDYADFEDFDDYGLIRLKPSKSRSGSFSITPFGHQYYEYLKAEDGNRAETMEEEMKAYLSSERFSSRFPVAWDKWSKAHELQHQPNAETAISQIGHLCREAVQEFADALVEVRNNDTAPTGKASTVKRLKWVFEYEKDKHPKSRIQLFEALTAYWGALQDLVARQEHDGQKEGEPVSLEESRCLVFQSLNVMYEISRWIK